MEDVAHARQLRESAQAASDEQACKAAQTRRTLNQIIDQLNQSNETQLALMSLLENEKYKEHSPSPMSDQNRFMDDYDD